MATLAAWIAFNSLDYMGAMIVINTYPHLTEQARADQIRGANWSYWITLTITGCLSAGLLVFVWRRAG